MEVLGYPHIARLAGSWVDQIRSLEDRGLTSFFVRTAELSRPWVHDFAAFDLIISYLHDPESVFHGNLRRCSEARIIRGCHRPDETRGRHATACFLEPLVDLGIAAPDAVPRLACTLGGSAEPESGGGEMPCLAVHPGSGSDRKNWPASMWNELLHRWVRKANARLLVVSGEAEVGRLDDLLRGLDESDYLLAHNLPLDELARRLGFCQGYLGHDSGITHLAAAVGLPGLVLWGPSNLAVWRPCSEAMRVLQPPGGLANLNVAQVWDKLHEACPFLKL